MISQADFDAATSAANRTIGEVDAIEATIAKKTIRAPFAGRLGIRSVNLGQFVRDGDAIVSAALARSGLRGLQSHWSSSLLGRKDDGGARQRPTRRPDEVFDGKVTALNPQFDPSTRNIKVQATVANPTGSSVPACSPGSTLVQPETRDLLVVPATAVLHAPYGDSVFVVSDVKDEKSGKTVQQVQMTTVRLGDDARRLRRRHRWVEGRPDSSRPRGSSS